MLKFKKLKRFSHLQKQWGDFSQSRLLLFVNFVCSFLLFTSCYSGGGVVGGIKDQSTQSPVLVDIPTITSPAQTPYYSKDSQLTISGMCMTDYLVTLTGSSGLSLGETKCVNNSFTFAVNEYVDGFYSFLITQTNLSGVVSVPTALVWVRKTSVANPVISSPTTSPYLSAAAQITISGACETGATVSLSGDGTGSTTCANSHFSLNLPKSVDGLFNIQVVQTDPAGNTASQNLVWRKQALVVSPSSPTLQVMTGQVLAFSGGSGVYNLTVTDNQSGGAYDSATQTYTTGTLANVIDRLTLTDSLGVAVTVSISTVAGNVDHFSYAMSGQTDISGNNQSGTVGQNLPNLFVAKVVDRYENPISHYPVYFQTIEGHSTIISPTVQFSDLAGLVQIQVKAGSSDRMNKVQMTPVAGGLPDLALTGHTRLIFDFMVEGLGRGSMGSTFKLGQNPNGLVIKDFNEDGILDVITLNSGDPSLGVLLGQGTGTGVSAKGSGLFSSMTKVNSVCNSPNGIIAADVNGDGHQDILITCGNSMTTALQVFLGRGDGTFQTAVNVSLDPSENIPYGIVVADFNGDGKLDVATTNAGSGKVSIRLGNGDGTFGSPLVVNVGVSPGGLAVGDFNHDGKKDLVVLNSGDGSMTFLMNTTPHLGALSFDNSLVLAAGNSPVAVQALDLNGDGYDDLVILNTGDGSVSVQLNDQTGSFNEVTSLVVGTGANGLLVTDLNADNKADIVVTNSGDNNISFFTGKGGGLFDSHPLISVVTNPVAVAAAEVTGDTGQDLLIVGIGNRELQVLPGLNVAASTQFGYVTTVSTGPTTGTSCDVDGDGRLDAIILSPGAKSIDILTGHGNGLFTLASSLNTNDSSSAVLGVDTRHQGTCDLIAVNNTKSQIRLFLNNGSGGFAAPSDITVGTSPVAIAAQDFNHDGYLDLVVVNNNGNSVSVLLGNGDGTFSAKQDYAVGGSPTGVSIADFNGDGVMDLVVSNQSSNSVSILLGNGDGTFQTHVDYSVGTAPVAVVAADLNGDGQIDVVTANSGDGTISVLLGNGDGSLRSSNQFSAGLNPTGLILGDFNGDQKLDLAVANGPNNQFTVLYGTGSGQFNTSISYDTGSATPGLIGADFNSDGQLDIGTFDPADNIFRLWLGH